MILKIVLLSLLLILITVVLFFLICVLVPAVKEQTKIFDNTIFSKIEKSTSKLYKNVEEVNVSDKKAYVLCSCEKKLKNATNSDINHLTCSIVNSQFTSLNDCKFSCIGLGDCAKVCEQNAISIINSTAVITNFCNGCGKCIEVCPKKLITLVSKEESKIVQCVNLDSSLTTCTEKAKEKNINFIEKKYFKIWYYCYKIFKRF